MTTDAEKMSAAEKMAAAMSKCFDLEHKAAIGMAISMVAAYYLDVVLGGSKEYKEEGVDLFRASVHAFLFKDSSVLGEHKRELH